MRTIVKLDGKDFPIFDFTLRRLQKMKVTLNDDFYHYLENHYYPDKHITGITLDYLIECEYYNRLLYSKSKGLGRISLLDIDGSIIQRFKTPLDAAHCNNGVFWFEYAETDGIDFNVGDYIFYGAKLKNYLRGNNTIPSYAFRELNQKIRKAQYYLNPKNKYFSEQKAIATCFEIGNTITRLYNNDALKDKIKRRNLSFDEYSSAINPLFQRYSHNGTCLFNKVNDINHYDYPGIYIFCFDNSRGYYIGRSLTSIKKRVLQHFKQPNSQFDYFYAANEVTSLYAMPYTNDEIMIDFFEADCISMMPNTFLLNVLQYIPGCGLPLLIDNESYNPENYRLPNRELSKYLKIIYDTNSKMV